MLCKRCANCRRMKPVTEFYRNRQHTDGYQSYCKGCTKKAVQKHHDDPGNFARLMYTAVKRRAKQRGVGFNLTRRWFERALDDNKCAVSDIPFVYDSKKAHPFQPSVDRIDSSKGYTPKNSQMVVMIYNYCKHVWSHDVVMKFARAMVRIERRNKCNK